MKTRIAVLLLIAAAWTAGCAIEPSPVSEAGLSDDAIVANASAAPLQIEAARVFTDNEEAHASKVRLVESAQSSVDLMYFIFADDYSSAVLSKALIAAAQRGVRVRMLVDYPTNYKNLDHFLMMERDGNAGEGSLEVRLYSRPTRHIVQDAAFMTMGCGSQSESRSDCDDEKFATIQRAFADEEIDGNISNLNVGRSGLFLSGLYAKNADAMALAILKGQDIDLEALGSGSAPQATPEERKQLAEFAKTYALARLGSGYQRLENQLKLWLAFQLYGEQVGPIFDTFTSYLPAQKPDLEEGLRDWEHVTDYIHHKLLLVDNRKVQLGGRNVEDSYHMHPNPLNTKYVFVDVDLYAEIKGDGGARVGESFEKLWTFQEMVARLDEVQRHAPNDFVANVESYREAEKSCQDVEKIEREACTGERYAASFENLDARIEKRRQEMSNNAETYHESYDGSGTPTSPTFEIDAGAWLAYLENLPFGKDLPSDQRRRIYGASSSQEAESGKYIHQVWERGLVGTCATATAEQPKNVIFHHAYFLPTSNLFRLMAQMSNGEIDCRHVTLRILTNSIATTDLSPVNVLARHAVKAFVDFYQEKSDASNRIGIELYEIQKLPGDANISLHAKVTILGDDMVIGSANADVRSYMMDTNNAMLIRGAPGLVADYTAFVDEQVAGDSVVQLNEYYRSVDRKTMVEEDLQTLRETMARYGVAGRLDAMQTTMLESRFVQLLDEVYNLTTQTLSSDEGDAARDDYNRIFQGF